MVQVIIYTYVCTARCGASPSLPTQVWKIRDKNSACFETNNFVGGGWCPAQRQWDAVSLFRWCGAHTSAESALHAVGRRASPSFSAARPKTEITATWHSTTLTSYDRVEWLLSQPQRVGIDEKIRKRGSSLSTRPTVPFVRPSDSVARHCVFSLRAGEENPWYQRESTAERST